MNWKRYDTKWSQPKVICQNLPGTNKNHEKPQSGSRVSELRYEPGTSGTESRSINHLATRFGDNI
jgi:hypothetical protein